MFNQFNHNDFGTDITNEKLFNATKKTLDVYTKTPEMHLPQKYLMYIESVLETMSEYLKAKKSICYDEYLEREVKAMNDIEGDGVIDPEWVWDRYVAFFNTMHRFLLLED